ncbi:uncharacterized protein LOC122508322 [Leptopilina heterotoma]|uniref:uncharacterized protein LOC122508322 n=1 Tax=Leptopilina heterotoma TaxID=63436 RepID=UPI001CA83277|nr:uncharacterized protein LOC122508322 [Leptopilina heterotoma]XP_043477535.1 uncharacterized protein LOC122508322 [Leptopilina heterotoma]
MRNERYVINGVHQNEREDNVDVQRINNEEINIETNHERRNVEPEGVEYDSDENNSSSSEDELPEIDEDDDDEDEILDGLLNRNIHEPLYRGAPVTLAQSMLLILALFLHHNLSLSCIADIITVINFHCLNQNLKKNSLYKFLKFFSLNTNNGSVKKIYYCSTCIRELPNAKFRCPSCPRKKNSYFVQIAFIDQLKEMFKRQNFYNSLQYRFRRPLQNYLSDIYDGSVYKEWLENGFLSNPNNISLSWYTDGIPVFKSSKISAWPVYLTINELPPQERKKRENILLAGLWYGPEKPDMNTFFKSFYSEFQKLLEGVRINVPELNAIINVRGLLLTGTCDLPAKASCLNFTHHNGDYGCPICFYRGETIHLLNTGGNIHVYPYAHNFYLRTLDECKRLAETGTEKVPDKGVKGPTSLSLLMPDFIKGMAIDRMHGVDGGVVKKILTLLFDVKYRAYDFSLINAVDTINRRYCTGFGALESI